MDPWNHPIKPKKMHCLSKLLEKAAITKAQSGKLSVNKVIELQVAFAREAGACDLPGCGSEFFPTADHIIPKHMLRWLGYDPDHDFRIEWYQCLCRRHNVEKGGYVDWSDWRTIQLLRQILKERTPTGAVPKSSGIFESLSQLKALTPDYVIPAPSIMKVYSEDGEYGEGDTESDPGLPRVQGGVPLSTEHGSVQQPIQRQDELHKVRDARRPRYRGRCGWSLCRYRGQGQCSHQREDFLAQRKPKDF